MPLRTLAISHMKGLGAGLALLLFCAFSLRAQQRVTGDPVPQPPAQPPATANFAPYNGYMIASGDVLEVRVANEDDVSGQYQVNGAGNIQLPLLSKPIHAAGATTFQLSQKVSEALKEQAILREPSVTTFILRGVNHDITVLGPVARPGLYPLEKPNTTLLEAISMSGGLQPNAGPTLTLTHQSPHDSGHSTTADPKSAPGVTTIDVSDLMSGRKPNLNVAVEPGDVITVSTAAVVYVVGAVNRPGAFAVQDSRRGLTVLQALAMVEGTQSTASLGHAVIVRQADTATGTGRREIPVNLSRVMKGKAENPILEGNDILFVPQSGFKAGMQRTGLIATQAASEVAGYGLGLRLGQY